MDSAARVSSWVESASRALNVPLHGRSEREAAGPCPKCKMGTDRLVVFIEGNAWCRQCGWKGWWTEDKSPQRINDAKKAKFKRQLALRNSMGRHAGDWIQYNKDVREDLWEDHGIRRAEITRFGLGFCEKSPLAPDSRSLTIPVFYGGRLVDIRHRLLDRDSGDKYRSHIKGISPFMFNLDSTKGGGVIYVVEGEKKAIVMYSCGFKPITSYPGIGFRHMLPPILSKNVPDGTELVLIPDPGSFGLMGDVGKELRGRFRVSIVELFEKPDDFIIEYGPEYMASAIDMRRPL